VAKSFRLAATILSHFAFKDGAEAVRLLACPLGTHCPKGWKTMKTIYGECVYGETRAPVTISQLKPEECLVALKERAAGLIGEVELWIGAIGPFDIVAARAEGRGFAARFKTPLEPAIINHFNA
jgi:hypothetical protein